MQRVGTIGQTKSQGVLPGTACAWSIAVPVSAPAFYIEQHFNSRGVSFIY